MAEEAVAYGIGDDLGRDGKADAQPKARRPDGRTLILWVAVPVVLLGGGAGGYFTGAFDPRPAQQAANYGADAAAVRAAPIRYELPDLLVTLNDGSGTSNVLKISATLTLEDGSAVRRLETVMPLVIDNFRVFLREFSRDDLTGPSGAERLREELLLRVNAAIRPAKVRDVLVKEAAVQ